jgi:hypothetical protein
MIVGKPQAAPIGMESISIKEELPSSFEDTYNKLLSYINLLEPFVIQLATIIEKEKEVENKEEERLEELEKEKKEEESRQVEEEC